jgi:hypothetical protein
MDWSKIELVVYAKDATTATGSIFLPGDREAHELTITKETGWFKKSAFKLARDPFAGKVAWTIRPN